MESSHSPTSKPPRGPAAGRTRPVAVTVAVAVLTVASTGLGLAYGRSAKTLEEARDQRVEQSLELADLRQRAAAAEARATALEETIAALRGENTSEASVLDKGEDRLRRQEAALATRAARLAARERELAAQERRLAADQSRPVAVDAVVDDPGPRPDADVDRQALLAAAEDVVADVSAVDRSLADGVGTGSALAMLAASYGRLADAGVPPRVDSATWTARLTTLQSFADEAATLAEDEPVEAAAKYAVLRSETEILLTQLNRALGSDLALL